MPGIVDVRARRFRLPMAKTIALSTGSRSFEEHVLVTVRAEDGAEGHAECVPRIGIYGETPRGAAGMIETHLAPLVEGLPISAGPRIAAALAKVAGNPAARSSIEIAAFDAFARHVGIPAYRLLGAEVSDVACCAMLGYGEPEEVLDRGQEQIDLYGVRAIKFKVGPDLERDIGVARTLREGLGSGVALYPDGNRLYSAAEGLAFVEATQDLGLMWLEELTDPDDLVGRRRVAERSGCPILGDESCTTARSVVVEFEAGRVGGVSIKPARTGIVGSSTIRDYCAAQGAPAIVGSQGDSAIGAMVSAAFAAVAPPTSTHAAEVLFFKGLGDDIVADLPEVAAGKMTLSDSPGFGFEIDQERLESHRVSD